MTEDPQAWKGKFIPLDLPKGSTDKVHKGLPPTEAESAKSPIDQRFDNVYSALEAAVEANDSAAYIKGLGELTDLMKSEVREQHQPPNFGDLPHTFMLWYHQIYSPGSGAIDKGADVVKLTNTVDNNHRPHKDFPGDRTMRDHSVSFGTAVADYINRRGHNFITGSIQAAEGPDVSHFQVRTTFKGFPQKDQQA